MKKDIPFPPPFLPGPIYAHTHIHEQTKSLSPPFAFRFVLMWVVILAPDSTLPPPHPKCFSSSIHSQPSDWEEGGDISLAPKAA